MSEEKKRALVIRFSRRAHYCNVLLSTGVWRAPSSYAEAKKWLESRAGYHVVRRDEKEDQVFVVVGVHGRSAQAEAQSMNDRDVQDAFVKAVGTVGTKL